MISDVLTWLSCPHCATALTAGPAGTPLRCEEGHAFDLARQGYLSLLTGPGTAGTADTAAMVADRAEFLAAGHYAPLADLLADLAAAADRGVADREAAADQGAAEAGACIVDIGAGTGYYLARVLEATDRPGIALDVSKHAARYAAKAHPRIGAVVADVWAGLPVRGRAASVVLNVFAPRNPLQMRRVLHPAGRAIVVVPEAEHLRELIARYGLLAVDDRKPERLRAQFGGRFEVVAEHPVRRTLDLSAREVAQVVGMGPNAWHGDVGRVVSGARVTFAVRAYVLAPR